MYVVGLLEHTMHSSAIGEETGDNDPLGDLTDLLDFLLPEETASDDFLGDFGALEDFEKDLGSLEDLLEDFDFLLGEKAKMEGACVETG